jgi:hypothetical protein
MEPRVYKDMDSRMDWPETLHGILRAVEILKFQSLQMESALEKKVFSLEMLQYMMYCVQQLEGHLFDYGRECLAWRQFESGAFAAVGVSVSLEGGRNSDDDCDYDAYDFGDYEECLDVDNIAVEEEEEEEDVCGESKRASNAAVGMDKRQKI